MWVRYSTEPLDLFNEVSFLYSRIYNLYLVVNLLQLPANTGEILTQSSQSHSLTSDLGCLIFDVPITNIDRNFFLQEFQCKVLFPKKSHEEPFVEKTHPVECRHGSELLNQIFQPCAPHQGYKKQWEIADLNYELSAEAVSTATSRNIEVRRRNAQDRAPQMPLPSPMKLRELRENASGKYPDHCISNCTLTFQKNSLGYVFFGETSDSFQGVFTPSARASLGPL